jgi:hypothetical protein
MSILDDEDVLIRGVQKTIHQFNILQAFTKIDDDGYKYIDECDFDNIRKLLNEIWDCSKCHLFNWEISTTLGECSLHYNSIKYNCRVRVCQLGIYNPKRRGEFRTIFRPSQICDCTFREMPDKQREELYNAVKIIQNKIIKKLDLKLIDETHLLFTYND